MRAFYHSVSLILAIVWCVIADDADPPVGFWGKTAIFIGAYLGSYVGAKIGDCLRKIAHPDAFITSGGMSDILKTKFFWAFGPQLIGMGIGSLIGMSILGAIFGLGS